MARDGALVSLFKPAGMAVHPTSEKDGRDLLTWAKDALDQPDLALIHRLDRETSGVVLCSCDATERAALGKWWADGEVKKVYQALVFGVTRPKGVIRRPLKDARRGHMLDSVTRYTRVEEFERWSLLRVSPETGRKHQIRRHLQGLGHSVIGDGRYRPRGRKSVPAFPGRLWLHALRIQLPDGRVFEAPLAPELVAHLEVLRGRDG